MAAMIRFILLMLLFGLICSIGYGQSTVLNQGNVNTLTNQLGGVGADKWLRLPLENNPTTTTRKHGFASVTWHNGIPALQLWDTTANDWVVVVSDTGAAGGLIDTARAIRRDMIGNWYPQDSSNFPQINGGNYNMSASINMMESGKLIIVSKSSSGLDAHSIFPSSVVIRTCTDGQGISWSQPDTIFYDGVHFTPVTSGVGNDNRLLMAYNLNDVGNDPDDGLFVQYSDDEGATWSGQISVPLPSYITKYHLFSGGMIIKIEGDSLLLPWFSYSVGDTARRTFISKSGDNGLTWGTAIEVLQKAAGDSTPYSEASYVYIGNSTIIGMIRLYEDPYFQQVKSIDNGTTWTSMGLAMNIDSSTGALNGTMQLQKFYHPSGRLMLVCYYHERVFSRDIRAIYGYASDVRTSVNNWVSNSRVSIASNTSAFALNYPCFIHPNNSPSGIGVCFVDSATNVTDSIAYLQILYTPKVVPLAMTGGVTLTYGTQENNLPLYNRPSLLELNHSNALAGSSAIRLGANFNSFSGLITNNVIHNGSITALSYNILQHMPFNVFSATGNIIDNTVDFGIGGGNGTGATRLRFNGADTAGKTTSNLYLEVNGRIGATLIYNLRDGSATTDSLLVEDDSSIIHKIAPLNTILSGYVTAVTGTSPIASSGGTTPAISIQDAAADGSTKGAASFTASDFDATSGNIAIDYTNGQAASAVNKGFLTSADWTTFNNKFTLPALTSGSVIFSNGTTLSQDNAAFFWNNTNDWLGLGGAPTHTLTLAKDFAVSDGISMTDAGGGFFRVTQSTSTAGAFQPIFDGYATGVVSSLIFKGLRSTTATDGTAGTKTIRIVARESDDATPLPNNDIVLTVENGSTPLSTWLGSGAQINSSTITATMFIIGTTKWSVGSGDPNGVLVGSPGDYYSNTAGGAGTTLYVKESGSGTNTGWVGK